MVRSKGKSKNARQKVILVVEGEPFEIDKVVFDVLDKYERPKEILFVPKFKETENGKIIRKENLK